MQGIRIEIRDSNDNSSLTYDVRDASPEQVQAARSLGDTLADSLLAGETDPSAEGKPS